VNQQSQALEEGGKRHLAETIVENNDVPALSQNTGTSNPLNRKAQVDRNNCIITDKEGVMPVQNLSMCDLPDLNRTVDAGISFQTIYMDPPWRYGNKASRGAAENHYPTMSLPEIASLPVGELASENAHLHLWATNGFLFEAERLMQMWGFTYKSMLVWTKPQMGCGSYWRVSHEFLLLGVKGNLTFADRSLKSWVEADRKAHSQKPECVRKMIEKASPGPYLELFGRKPVKGWVVWGNEIERQAFESAVNEM